MYCLTRFRIWYNRRQAKINYTSIAMAPIGTSKSAFWLRNAKRRYNRAVIVLRKLDPSSEHLPVAHL